MIIVSTRQSENDIQIKTTFVVFRFINENQHAKQLLASITEFLVLLLHYKIKKNKFFFRTC